MRAGIKLAFNRAAVTPTGPQLPAIASSAITPGQNRRDPHGIHKVFWDQFKEEPFELPPDKPLTLASYVADYEKVAYVENVAVGDRLVDMPIFLTPSCASLTATAAGNARPSSTCVSPVRPRASSGTAPSATATATRARP